MALYTTFQSHKGNTLTFLEIGLTINSDSNYLELEEIHKKLNSTYPVIAIRKGTIILHDNARSYKSKNTIYIKIILKIEIYKTIYWVDNYIV